MELGINDGFSGCGKSLFQSYIEGPWDRVGSVDEHTLILLHLSAFVFEVVGGRWTNSKK